MKRKLLIINLVSLFFVVGLAIMAHASDIYYQPGFTDELYLFDTNTSSNTFIGNMGVGDSWGFSFNNNGTLYGFSRSDGGLYTINTNTAALSLIGLTGLTGLTSESLTFNSDSSVLYTMSGTNLYSLNTSTAAATLIGNLNQEIDGLSVNPLTGTIYGVDTGTLYSIDPNTLIATSLGLVNADETLAFGPDGTLYGMTAGIYTIDLNTLTGTLIGSYVGVEPFASAVAPEPVPEPATMFLLGTGLVGVAGAARRKRKNQA